MLPRRAVATILALPAARRRDDAPHGADLFGRKWRLATALAVGGILLAQTSAHADDPAVGGILVCGALMAGATVTGAARVMADAHYASDVLVGAAIGLTSGLLVPWLHYGGGWRSPELGSLRLLPAPVAVTSGGGMGVVGIF